MDKITVLFVDHYRMITNALASLLTRRGRFEIIGETSNKETALDITCSRTPGIILLNVDMSFIRDAEIIRMFRKYSPVTRIIGMSSHRMPSYAKQLLGKGLSGYLTMNTTVEELADGIIEVYEGKKFICNDIKNIITNRIFDVEEQEADICRLSKQELIIADYIRKGFSSKEIAGVMKRSTKTIEVHRYNIMKKLNIRNVAALVDFINRSGI